MEEQFEKIPAVGDKDNQNSYGKFKNADELFKAYNALEGEFTKRSQKLKQMEKTQVQNNNQEQSWEEKVNKFVTDFPIAETLAKDLADTVATDERYIKEEKGLEKALVDLLSSKVKTKDSFAEDTEVINKVLQNENNRQKVIDEYIKNISVTDLPRSLPKAGGVIPCSDCKATSFSEAGKLAQKFLEQK